MTKTIAHSWIKKIEPLLREEAGISKQGWIPQFDFPLFSSTLSKALGLEVSIARGTVEWKQGDHALLGFGSRACVYALESPLIRGPIFWIMADLDVQKIVRYLEPNGYASDPLVKGIYEYSLLEAIDAVQALSSFKAFSSHLTRQILPEHSPLYCVDISLQCQEEVLWGRLAVGKDAIASIEKHFASSAFPFDAFPNLPLTLHLSAGFVKLTMTQYQDLEEGDFVILDETFFRPKAQKGSFQLRIHDTSLFQVKIKEDQIKILDFSYDVEDIAMDMDEEEPLLDEEPEQEELKPQKIKLQEVPLTLHVEVKRLKMTLAELHALSPGQSIPLASGNQLNLVHLTLNGQAIAEGELMEISDQVIGVKLSKIYK